MQFRLIYQGPLPSGSAASAADKYRIRAQIAPQLAALWNQDPLKSHVTSSGAIDISLINTPTSKADPTCRFDVEGLHFCALVTSRLFLAAELDILFLRPCEPGAIVRHGGDLDNRLKTLLDGLRLPTAGELVPQERKSNSVQHVLLEDDAIVTRLHVESDRLLNAKSEHDVVLVITVAMRPTKLCWLNIGL